MDVSGNNTWVYISSRKVCISKPKGEVIRSKGVSIPRKEKCAEQGRLKLRLLLSTYSKVSDKNLSEQLVSKY